MKNELLQDLRSLVSDTLLFFYDCYPLQAIYPPSNSAPSPKVDNPEKDKPIIKAAEHKQNIPHPIPQKKSDFPSKEKKTSETEKSPSERRKKDESMLRLIADQLPHLPFAEEIPQKKPSIEVIIFVSEKEDLPFLQNLAKAIKQHFCPVKLIDLQKIQAMNKWDKVLSDKKNALFLLPASFRENFPEGLRGIFLAETRIYAENVGKKKQLWSEICQILKPSTQK